MKLTDHIYMVGSGEVGISDPGDCHTYLIDGGSEYALIDSGCGTRRSIDAIVANIHRDGLDLERLTQVILTHWHFDHAGGARAFRDRFGCKVLAPAGERALIEAGRTNIPACPVDVAVDDGDRISVGDYDLLAYCLPSHSEAITAYQLDTPEGRALFVGDIVFTNGVIGLLNSPGSDLAKFRQNLPRLAGLHVDSLLCGHMLFAVGDGQRHVDVAIRNVKKMTVPFSIGQFGVPLLPWDFPEEELPPADGAASP